MRVKLTKRAFKEIQEFATHAARHGKATIPSIGWSLHTEHRDKDGKLLRREGPRFHLGAVDANDPFGWTVCEQEGLTFAVALPEESLAFETVEIDYANGRFIISN